MLLAEPLTCVVRAAQGINVRHKSATLAQARARLSLLRTPLTLTSAARVDARLQLLNDAAKIEEVRAKALANRNKYSGVSAADMRSSMGVAASNGAPPSRGWRP